MATKPYLRAADDGTYELIVTSGKGRVHVLPYCFHTEEDAMIWLSSRKGREAIRKLGAHVQPAYATGEAERALS